LYSLVQTIAHLQPLGALHQAVDKFPVNALLHNHATRCRAALASSSEGSPESAFNGKVEVGVVEHDHWILAAQFQRAVLETLGCDPANDATNSRRSRE